MASGGDTYYVFKTKKAVETGVPLNELLEEYALNKLGGVLPKEIYGSIHRDQRQILTEDASSASDRYTVVRGDYLSRIAKEKLGDDRRWVEIYELNRDTITDPDMIYPGQSLILPAA